MTSPGGRQLGPHLGTRVEMSPRPTCLLDSSSALRESSWKAFSLWCLSCLSRTPSVYKLHVFCQEEEESPTQCAYPVSETRFEAANNKDGPSVPEQAATLTQSLSAPGRLQGEAQLILKDRGMLAGDKGRSPKHLEIPDWKAEEVHHHQPRVDPEWLKRWWV